MRVDQAMQLASRFHEGATDKAGQPYMGHVQRVADAVDTHEEKLAAAMHDLLEDTPLTRTHLFCAGCPSHTLAVVEALTRSPEEDYEVFCRRAASNPVARVVKLADIGDNADEGRLSMLEPQEASRLRTKYERARSVLLEPPEHQAEKTQQEYETEFATIGVPQEVGESWSTFWCAVCGLPAGTLTLVRSENPDISSEPPGLRLVLTTFLGSSTASIREDELEDVRSSLQRDDVLPFFHRNPELVPFWCPDCQMSYCNDHWNQQFRFDDGFFDDVVGTCPNGHRRQLWD